jgi:hypothetical protein
MGGYLSLKFQTAPAHLARRYVADTLSVDKPEGSTCAKNPFQAWELSRSFEDAEPDIKSDPDQDDAEEERNAPAPAKKLVAGDPVRYMLRYPTMRSDAEPTKSVWQNQPLENCRSRCLKRLLLHHRVELYIRHRRSLRLSPAPLALAAAMGARTCCGARTRGEG